MKIPTPFISFPCSFTAVSSLFSMFILFICLSFFLGLYSSRLQQQIEHYRRAAAVSQVNMKAQALLASAWAE